ncbi:site-specific DNA-methyltransferase [Haloarculaceae archaeon H-GB2-1]|nr:site-specific DNA-methyltransferase [Haloarculaceae archaeon H-GB1-1]MEA5388959.1 site-specific DNA-methyltransferase [Haloarculaceae archaeon H-GB11]MEA5407016.1 site-specific DNA-methyltransferase [Haloarculaceae archaeon H-GB2-1]
METTHRVYVDDARELTALDDDSVDLVVTSPPYPMIEMWDDLFAELDPAVGDHLDDGDGNAAFDAMHDVLDAVWAELRRVLVPGGIACINVGDATRKVDDSFRVYPNHARIVEAFTALGFEPLPDILWRKPVNSAAKFMGSGMLPPNAYVTLEHEYVLVFRNGPDSRSFEPGADRRYDAAYFWEERNRWFSDVWTEVAGERQALDGDDLRERSAAFPFEIPYRLVNMYSVYGDTVLDPFWGTGTTSLAAMIAGRNSVGTELDPEFVGFFDDRVDEVPSLSRDVVADRLDAHREFVADYEGDLAYDAAHYDFPVQTKQERSIRLYSVADVDQTDNGYRAVHEPSDAD